MPGIVRTGLKDSYLRLLSDDEVEQIHQGSLQLLAKTGLIIHDEQMLALLAGLGGRVDREARRLYLAAGLVEESLALAPAQVNLYNRFGQPAMALGAGPLHARTSSGATGILDLANSHRREPTSQDLAHTIRLADALPQLHGVSTMAVQPADVPVTMVDVHTVRLALANTVKPLGYVCLNERLIEPVLAMAAAVAGSETALVRRPFITALAESTSPLQLVASQLAVLRAFAARGLPLTLHAHPIAGFTAPVTLAGELVITHAEVLALATIAQLIRPGSPVVYGMSASVPDMRSAANLSGAVEIGLLGGAVARLAQRVGLPAVMSSGSDAHQPGPQAMLERLVTLLPPALAGIDLINLSTLATKMSFNLAQLVIDNEVLAVIGRLLRGVSVNEETLALELIHRVGPGGAFIDTDHTLAHFRDELFSPDLTHYDPRDDWLAAGAPDMITRAQAKARAILAEHTPPPLPEEIEARLDEIVRETELIPT